MWHAIGLVVLLLDILKVLLLMIMMVMMMMLMMTIMMLFRFLCCCICCCCSAILDCLCCCCRGSVASYSHSIVSQGVAAIFQLFLIVFLSYSHSTHPILIIWISYSHHIIWRTSYLHHILISYTLYHIIHFIYHITHIAYIINGICDKYRQCIKSYCQTFFHSYHHQLQCWYKECGLSAGIKQKTPTSVSF